MPQCRKAKPLIQLLGLYAVRHRIQNIRIAAAQHAVNLARDLLCKRTAEVSWRSAELRAAYVLCRKAVSYSSGCIDSYRHAASRSRERYQSELVLEVQAGSQLQAAEKRCVSVGLGLMKLEARIEVLRSKLKSIRLKALDLQDAPSTE